jgi:hypothetical protein
MSAEEHIVAGYVFTMLFNDVAVPMLQHRWVENEIIQPRAVAVLPVEVPQVVYLTRPDRVIMSTISRYPDNNARKHVKTGPPRVRSKQELKRVRYVAGWSARRGHGILIRSGGVVNLAAANLLMFLNTNMVSVVTKSIFKRKPGEGLFRPVEELRTFVVKLDDWLECNLFQPRIFAATKCQTTAPAQRLLSMPEVAAAWEDVVATAIRRGTNAEEAANQAVKSAAMEALVSSFIRVRVWGELESRGFIDTQKVKQTTRGKLQHSTGKAEKKRNEKMEGRKPMKTAAKKKTKCKP